MDLKNYIDKAEKKAGSQIELAKYLGISTGYIRNAKANKSGLPSPLCMKLADYISEDRLSVVAASELITEKDEGRRQILKSCFSISRAASYIGVTFFIGLIMVMTPSAANAGEIMISAGNGSIH